MSTSSQHASPFSPLHASIGAPFAWDNVAALDELRQHGDEAADACAAELTKAGATGGQLRKLFATLRTTGHVLPSDAPAALRAFMESTKGPGSADDSPALPAWADRARILRGQEAFMTKAMMSVLVMLCRSLPEGYAAPSMARILNLSGELKARPFHRLMGTLQLLTDVSSPGSFEPGGVGPVVAQEMRLLHAGVRTNVVPDAMGDQFPAFRSTYGVPINQEDMLGTVLGFSVLVIDGLKVLGVPHTAEQAEDFYHVWRVFGHMMGIRRPGVPEGEDSMPHTLAEARTFYAAYQRHYVGAINFEGHWRERSMVANRDGVGLADAHVGMLKGVMTKRLQWLLGDRVARVYIRELTSEAACARIGIRSVRGHVLLHWLLQKLPPLWERITSRWGAKNEIKAAEWFFGTLIKASYSTPISYTVPGTLQDVKDLVQMGEIPEVKLFRPDAPVSLTLD